MLPTFAQQRELRVDLLEPTNGPFYGLVDGSVTVFGSYGSIDAADGTHRYTDSLNRWDIPAPDGNNSQQCVLQVHGSPTGIQRRADVHTEPGQGLTDTIQIRTARFGIIQYYGHPVTTFKLQVTCNFLATPFAQAVRLFDSQRPGWDTTITGVNDTLWYPFTISLPDPPGTVSKDTFRFKVVVYSQAFVFSRPFIFTQTNATPALSGGATITWAVQNEDSVVSYRLQQQKEQGPFVGIGHSISPRDEKQFQTGPGVFRIQAKKKDGSSSYSQLMVVRRRLHVYPNPSNGRWATLSFIESGHERTRVNVFDIRGSEVYSTLLYFAKGDTRLNLPNLSPGIYFLRVVTVSGETLTQKLIVQ